MLLPSFFIGCLPSYHHIGWTATALLVFLRLLQGIAVGGELVGAFIYTIEATNGKNRGFWGGACKATGNLGTSLGMGTAVALRYFHTYILPYIHNTYIHTEQNGLLVYIMLSNVYPSAFILGIRLLLSSCIPGVGEFLF